MSLLTDEEYDLEYGDAVHTYMNGSCMVFAAALHHTFGVQIEGAIDVGGQPQPGQIHNLYHVWVVMPNGKRFDIQGLQSFGEITQRAINNSIDASWEVEIRFLSLAEVEDICRMNLSKDQKAVQEAYDDFLKFTYLNRVFYNAM